MKRGTCFLLLFCLLLPLVACGSGSDVGTDPVSDVGTETYDEQQTSGGDEPTPTEPTAEIGGWSFSLMDGAVYSGGTLSGGSAVCRDPNLPNRYSLGCDMTLSRSGNPYIDFKINEEYGMAFRIRADVPTGYLYVLTVNGEDTSVLRRAAYAFKEGESYHIEFQCHYTFVRIFVSEKGKEIPEYPLLDFVLNRTRPNVFSLYCGENQKSLEGITLKELDKVTGTTYSNPVCSGADPYVLYYDGTYYMYATNAVMDGYKVYTSKDFSEWTDRGLCLRRADVYGEPTSSAGFWAPEVYEYHGMFYMVYTVAEHLGVATAPSPLGPFTNHATSFLNESSKEIDGHLFFDDDGKVYLFFVRTGKHANGKSGNEIYGAEFDMETLTYKNAKRLLAPSSGTWDYVSGYVAEGPCVLKHDGRYYLTYSGNGYTSQDYAIGLAISDSPLGEYQKYAKNPILSKDPENGVYGPGHHSFTRSPDGTELFIVYHRHKDKNGADPRVTCIDRAVFEFDALLGYDVLRVIGPTTTPQLLPSAGQ